MANKPIYANKCCICGKAFPCNTTTKEICNNCKKQIEKERKNGKKK